MASTLVIGKEDNKGPNVKTPSTTKEDRESSRANFAGDFRYLEVEDEIHPHTQERGGGEGVIFPLGYWENFTWEWYLRF